MTDEVEDFLAHYGVPGMKWGRRKSVTSVQSRAPSGVKQNKNSEAENTKSPSSDKKRLSPETKRKLAIGAGILSATAVIAVGAYAANKQFESKKIATLSDMRKQVETRRAGEAAAKKTFEAYNQKSSWKPSTYSKSNREGKKQALSEVENYKRQRDQRVKDFASRVEQNRADKERKQRRLNSLTPSGREKNRESDLQKARSQIQEFSKKSKWEIASQKSKTSTNLYSAKDSKEDLKLYGPQGQQRIQKRIDRGDTPSSARLAEAARQNASRAFKISRNIRKSQKKEGEDYKRLRNS